MGKIMKDEISKMKKISKVIAILSKIGYVFTIVIMVFVGIGMIASPIALFTIKNIKTTKIKVVEIENPNEVIIDSAEVTDDVSEEEIKDEKIQSIENNVLSEEIRNHKNYMKDRREKYSNGTPILSLNKIYNIIETKNNFLVVLIMEVLLLIPMITMFVYNRIMKNTYKIFKNFQEGETPFTEENIKSIKTIAKLIFVAILLPTIDEALFGYRFSFGSIMIALIIFALSYVFEYGYKLQKESDETL